MFQKAESTQVVSRAAKMARRRMFSWLLPGEGRGEIPPRKGGFGSSEPIVHAEAEDIGLKAVLDPGQHIALVGQLDIEIFGLGRPVRRQADLDAAADGPA